MNITANFSHTAKSRAILNAFDQAEILGNFRECFLTGKETTEFHTYYLNTPEGRIYRRVYLKLPVMSNLKMIELIEEKMNADLRNQLDQSTADINLNFRIKVSGTRDGIKYNKLVGVSGLIKILGLELANKLINRAFNSQDDNIYCKLRTRLLVIFYSK